jgi:hypothetical protein
MEGRYLKVIYLPDAIPESGFVITAYELGPKAKGRFAAFRGGDDDGRKVPTGRE